MKHNTKTKKTKMFFSKRIAASAIAVVSCFSLVAAPESVTLKNAVGLVSLEADAAESTYTVVARSWNGNDTLRPGKWHSSPNGKYFVVFDGNCGNFLLYENTYSGRKLRWNSKTSAPGGSCILQADGNLVIYSAYDANHNRKPVWDTHTSRKPLSSLVLTNDGDLYIVQGPVSNILGKRTWEARDLLSWPFPGWDRYVYRSDITIEIGDEGYRDIGCKGQRVIAMADGRVTRIDDHFIEVCYDNGIRSCMHFKIKSVDNVGLNSRVKKGQTIGYADGNTASFSLYRGNTVLNLDDHVLIPSTLHFDGNRVTSEV